jgi:hypothetical protein
MSAGHDDHLAARIPALSSRGQDAPSERRLERDLTVAERLETVDPVCYVLRDARDVFRFFLKPIKQVQFSGHPCSHSTHFGLRDPVTASFKYPVVLPVAFLLGLIPFLIAASPTVGVGYLITSVGKSSSQIGRCFPGDRSDAPLKSVAFGVGNIRTASTSVVPEWCLLFWLRLPAVAFAAFLLSPQVGVGHAL